MCKYELWVNTNYGGTDTQTNKHTNRQTNRHFNTMTGPGLGAGPSENPKKVLVHAIFFFIQGE